MPTAKPNTQEAQREAVAPAAPLDDGLAFARSEVLRAQRRVEAVERDYAKQIEAARFWLAETQSRLRALTLQRRVAGGKLAKPRKRVRLQYCREF